MGSKKWREWSLYVTGRKGKEKGAKRKEG